MEMTNAEAREHLKVILCDVPNDKCIDWIEALKKAIKALEQQPFINKPCVSEGICREDKMQVLDKIRAEIIQMPTISSNANDIYKADVLEIIDKYRTEERDE